MSESLSQHEQCLYMEAMGLALWTARYRLPNAEEMPACEWPEEARREQVSPSQRLQALRQDTYTESNDTAAQSIDKGPAVSSSGSPDSPVISPRVAVSPSSSGEATAEASASSSEQSSVDVSQEPPALNAVAPVLARVQTLSSSHPDPVSRGVDSTSSQEESTVPVLQDSLTFSFHAIMLGKAWWVLSSQTAFDAQSLAFLNNVLSAIGHDDRAPAHPVAFQWPMIEGFQVEDPQAEAEEGVLAFVAGQQEQQGKPASLLLFADEDDENAQVLSHVLGLKEGASTLLSLPLVRGAGLSSLMSSDATHKRALWQRLSRHRDAIPNSNR